MTDPEEPIPTEDVRQEDVPDPAELARLEETIVPPVRTDPTGDVAVRTQKATLIRKYEKVTFDLAKITASKRRLNSLRKMDAADMDGSIVESLDKLAKEAAELADLLRNRP